MFDRTHTKKRIEDCLTVNQKIEVLLGVIEVLAQEISELKSQQHTNLPQKAGPQNTQRVPKRGPAKGADRPGSTQEDTTPLLRGVQKHGKRWRAKDKKGVWHSFTTPEEANQFQEEVLIDKMHGPGGIYDREIRGITGNKTEEVVYREGEWQGTVVPQPAQEQQANPFANNLASWMAAKKKP